MSDFSKELNELVQAAKALADKAVGLQKQLREIEQRHPKPKKAKAPAKGVAGKKRGKTDLERVLSAIGRYKKGTDATTVIAKTGLPRQKVYSAVSLLKKQGKIVGAGYGKYVKV